VTQRVGVGAGERERGRREGGWARRVYSSSRIRERGERMMKFQICVWRKPDSFNVSGYEVYTKKTLLDYIKKNSEEVGCVVPVW
jgi:hypothetical protein